jgi:GAF domain-containing protein
MTFAATDPRIDELHDLQFQLDEGPAVEALRYNEPRRIDDIDADHRWPAFRRAAARARFGSCLMLPLRTDSRPSGAISLYSEARAVFRGSSHDLALLFAAQGGTAVHNATIYQTSQRMIANLHTALRSRAMIEQAKGILHAKLGVSPDEAFRLLSRRSHHTNRKLRAIASDLVHGVIDSSEFRP